MKNPIWELVFYVLGQVACVVAFFYGTNLTVESPAVFFGGLAVAIGFAILVRCANRGS